MIRAIALFLALLAFPAAADDYYWPLRDPIAYDGDTIYIVMPGLPPELAEMSVRILGIDTPEVRGDCPAEKILALIARGFTRSVLAQATIVVFRDVAWDKYGGRILAHVIVDGENLAGLLVAAGVARPYDGGPRSSWCPD